MNKLQMTVVLVTITIICCILVTDFMSYINEDRILSQNDNIDKVSSILYKGKLQSGYEQKESILDKVQKDGYYYFLLGFKNIKYTKKINMLLNYPGSRRLIKVSFEDYMIYNIGDAYGEKSVFIIKDKDGTISYFFSNYGFVKH